MSHTAKDTEYVQVYIKTKSNVVFEVVAMEKALSPGSRFFIKRIAFKEGHVPWYYKALYPLLDKTLEGVLSNICKRAQEYHETAKELDNQTDCASDYAAKIVKRSSC